jgi:hypothetical protein
MKLGLITDIHEHVDNLKRALAEFDARGVDQIVCLGDLIIVGDRIRETVDLLAERRIPGVWGNHDFGLCSHPSALDSTRRPKFTGSVLDYYATYRPFLEIDDCYFSHVEPWRDLNDIMGLWHFGEPLDALKSFHAVSHRVLFTGHRHRWMLATPEEVLSWDGSAPVVLAAPDRYFVVVSAVCEGWAATYDTVSGELVPIWMGS